MFGLGPTSGRGGARKAESAPVRSRHAPRNLVPASNAAGRRSFSGVAQRMRRSKLTWPPVDGPEGARKQGWKEAKWTARARRATAWGQRAVGRRPNIVSKWPTRRRRSGCPPDRPAPCSKMIILACFVDVVAGYSGLRPQGNGAGGRRLEQPWACGPAGRRHWI